MIARIVSKLDQLRAQGWQKHSEQIGVSSHQFRTNRPASLDELARFERQPGFSLPEDYRAFLAQVGDGGAGPYYGILPLAKANDALGLDGSDFIEALRRPCPLPVGYEPDADWEERLGCTRESVFDGTIALAHQGCAYYVLLVVKGPLRGRVIYVDLDGQPPTIVADASFLAWYERWLDETLADLEIFWFGFGPGGSDAKLLSDLTGDEPGTRATAATELGRRKKPGPEIVGALLKACGDDDTSVRASALQALRYAGGDGVPAGIRALNDADAEVRGSAAWLLNRLRDPRAAPALKVALVLAADHDAFFGIAGALSSMKELRALDLVSQVSSADERVRASAAYFLGNTGDAAAAVPLVKLLDDAAARVRLNAVQALGAIRDARTKAALEARRKVEDDELVLKNLDRVIHELAT